MIKMFRYTPEFILEKHAKGEVQGTLSGAMLLLELVNIPAISAIFHKDGDRGAQELGRLLVLAFSRPLQIIRDHGAFVSHFDFGALYAIFPQAEPRLIISAVNSINMHLKNRSRFHSSLGDIALSLRQSISHGDIHWEIFRDGSPCEYTFYSPVFQELADISLHEEAVLFSSAAAQQLGLSFFEEQDFGYRLISDEIIKEKTALSFDYPAKSLEAFTPPDYLGFEVSSQIRNAAFCFVNLGNIEPDSTAAVVHQIQNIVEQYGGFLHKYVFAPKGLCGIISFGLLKQTGRTLERATRFCLHSVQSMPKLEFGISCGSLISTYIGDARLREFTAFGACPKIAARLLLEAEPGQIISDSFWAQEMNAKYDFILKGSLETDGLMRGINFFSVGKKQDEYARQQELPFVGREEEIHAVRQLILGNESCGVIYISGDAGVGKSRLAQEVLTAFSEPAFQKYQLSCDAIFSKPLEAVKQIIKFIFDYNPKLSEAERIQVFRAKWAELEAAGHKMQNDESVVASLLGYGWEHSFWSMLSDAKKADHQKQAFARLLCFLAQLKAMIIYIDDGQWLDPESKAFFQALNADDCPHPITILSTCRYLTNGERVDFGIEAASRHDVDLDSLDYLQTKALTKSILAVQDLPEPTQELIYSKSMGNPLFIEQFTRYLQESSYLNERGILSADIGYLSSYGMKDIIISRIDRLTLRQQESVFHASVLGIEFRSEVLEQMLGYDATEELETGVQYHIWRQLGSTHYSFSHILILDAAYKRISSPKLKLLHKAAAEALQSVQKDRLEEYSEEIAIHFEKAGILDKAAHFFDVAGSYCWRIFMFERAKSHYKKAIAFWELSVGKADPLYAESVFHLALLLHYLRDFTTLEPLYLEVLKINEANYGSDSHVLSPYINNLGRFYKDIGRYQEAETLLQRSLDIEISLDANGSNVADRLNNLGHLYVIQKEYDKAKDFFLQAMDILDQYYEDDFWFTAVVLANLGGCYLKFKQYKDAEPLLLRSLKINEKRFGNADPAYANSLNLMAQLYQGQRKLRKAESYFEQALKIYESTMGSNHEKTISTQKSLNDLRQKRRPPKRMRIQKPKRP